MSENLERYKKIFKLGESMIEKILQATRNLPLDPAKIAKSLGIRTAGKVVIFNDESEQNIFSDYSLHVYKINGKSRYETAAAFPDQFTPEEFQLLQAEIQSKATFFEVGKINTETKEIEMIDLLAPGNPMTRITNINLAGTLERIGIRLLLFTRIVQHDGIAFSSGFYAGFFPEDKQRLLQALHQKTKKAGPDELQASRFAFFVQKQRECGVSQQTRQI